MQVFDRVKESSTTTGTGNFTLAGAAIGFVTFTSVYADGINLPYVIALGTEWEVGIGTLTGGTTLQRNTILASSNANAAVNFAAGTKDVFCTVPAAIATKFRTYGQSYATARGYAMQ